LYLLDGHFCSCQEDSLSHVGDIGPVSQTHVSFVSRVQFVSGASDGTVALWSLATRTRISHRNMPGPVSSLLSWRNFVFVAGGASDVLVMDWRTFEAVGVLQGHRDIVHLSDKVLPKSWVATASLDNNLRLWTVPDFRCVQNFTFDVCVVSISTSENTGLISLFALFEDNAIRHISIDNGQTLARWQLNRDISPAFISVLNQSLFVAWRDSEVPSPLLHPEIEWSLLLTGGGTCHCIRQEAIQALWSIWRPGSDCFCIWCCVLLLQLRNNLLLGVALLGGIRP
jgi:WD40 repeat protein